ncbi:energy transducer TonB [Porticoccus sp. W117]|uniref:energy transducer TonB n=1 Tax=Porticoccus sp. W117 TaxID=3054777 RepID=UPI002597A791|nr:energy transducer TonB [Porticoccus sp. W117]MDM3872300.1 energy transducer TonB [Porticoccus sp. W117]
MKVVRLGLSGLLGFTITFGLLVLMYTLVSSDVEAPDEGEGEVLANIFQAEEEIEDNFKKFDPQKPEPKEPPPPRVQQQAAKAEDVQLAVNIDAPRVDSGLNIGSGGFGGNSEARPIKRVAPRYPQRALERGLEGFVVVEFTVSVNGVVLDPRVVDGQVKNKDGSFKPSTVFNSESIRAAKKLKFKPKMEDNQPVEFITTYQFTFELEKDS